MEKLIELIIEKGAFNISYTTLIIIAALFTIISFIIKNGIAFTTLVSDKTAIELLFNTREQNIWNEFLKKAFYLIVIISSITFYSFIIGPTLQKYKVINIILDYVVGFFLLSSIVLGFLFLAFLFRRKYKWCDYITNPKIINAIAITNFSSFIISYIFLINFVFYSNNSDDKYPVIITIIILAFIIILIFISTLKSFRKTIRKPILTLNKVNNLPKFLIIEFIIDKRFIVLSPGKEYSTNISKYYLYDLDNDIYHEINKHTTIKNTSNNS